MLRTPTGGLYTLFPDVLVPPFGNRRVRALAFSPDGKALVFGLGHEVLVLNLASKDLGRICIRTAVT